MRLRFIVGPVVLCLAVQGCAPWPEVSSEFKSRRTSTEIPRIVPLDTLLANRPSATETSKDIDDVSARVARLKARAARLRAPVIDPRTRRKLRRAIAAQS